MFITYLEVKENLKWMWEAVYDDKMHASIPRKRQAKIPPMLPSMANYSQSRYRSNPGPTEKELFGTHRVLPPLPGQQAGGAGAL